MRIKQINRQHRRDFYADYECENCGHIEKDKYGYDDTNFHVNVIPNIKCPKCGKNAKDLGSDYRPLTTKYPDWKQV